MLCSSASILLGTLATYATRTGKHPHCALEAPARLRFDSCPSVLALAIGVHPVMGARAGVLQPPRCRACSRCVLKAGLTQRVQG